MRRLLTSIALAGSLSLLAIPVASAASAPPVTLSGKTNTHGQKDLSASPTAKLKLEQNDFYFAPTFVKVAPGEQITITIKNEGTTAHSFTSDALNVDKTVQPGKTTKVKITIPTAGGTIEFHCHFHQSMGMQGAFYTAAAGSGSAAPSATPATVSLADTRLGKVLVDANGHTLYQRDSDNATMVTCTDQCASIWPPLLATGTPTAGTGLDKTKLAVFAGPNGNQVTYGGHPLYVFSNDHAVGDVGGQGLAGLWWVVGADGNKITAT
jgi:predicted lipoprotein with Yx(FWY)xxD motif